MAEAEEKQRRRKGCGPGCLAAFLAGMAVFFLLVAAAVFLCASAGERLCRLRDFGLARATGRGEDEMPRMREVWSSGSGEIKVARIRLEGIISLDRGTWSRGGEGSAATALRAIRRATADSDVRAIILEIDSPGGGITDSDVLHHALSAFRESEEGRAVVALMGDMAASGGYYVALAADRILAHPTTLTGSIGVLLQSLNVRELSEKLGIRDITIKSGANKDLLNPLRDLSPEQAAMLQGVVDTLHARFVRLVASSRRLPEEEVRPLADGRVFLAEEARAAGLIDDIGYAADAETVAAELLGDDNLRFIRYLDEPSLMDFFRPARLFGAAEWRAFLRDESSPRLLYQWAL
jgi:protease-4